MHGKLKHFYNFHYAVSYKMKKKKVSMALKDLLYV